MKVLFIAEHLSYGGAPRRFIDLANSMADRGLETTIFVFNGSIEIKEIVNGNVKCIESRIETSPDNWLARNLFYRIKCIKYINKFLENNQYDVIISFNDMVNISILLSKNARKSKIVISERSDPNYNKKGLQIIKKIIFRKANGLVFQTNGARDFFGGMIRSKSIVIPNPIPGNVRFADYIGGKREKVIVNVARFWVYQKRQDILLKAFKKFSLKFPDYRLVLFGDGPDESSIKTLIKELELESKVSLEGVTSNVFESIKNANMFVLTSDFEGIPNALIEAMAVGLPVISTDCSPGGARELIEDEVNGVLVNKSDIYALYHSMLRIAGNPSFAQFLGDNAQKIVNKLNEDDIYDKWYDFLKMIINDK